MNLNEHYEQLWLNSLLKFKQGIFKTDPLIDATTDLRRGITLLIRPSDEVKDNIQKFFLNLRKSNQHSITILYRIFTSLSCQLYHATMVSR